jgi:predicted component of viral defense system (DUF524 family)
MTSAITDTKIRVVFNRQQFDFEIISERDNSLFSINEKDAIENGEAVVQILEGNAYEYQLPPNFQLRSSIKGVVSQSKKEKNRGRITPNIYVGTLTLYVSNDSDLSVEVPIKLEVLAIKFDTQLDTSYRVNYRKMLEDITSKSTDLLLQSGTPVSQNFEIDYQTDNKTLYQRFCFVRSVVDSKEFNEAISRIIASPKTNWKEEVDDIDVRKVRRFKSSETRQLVSKGNRVELSPNHNLRTVGLSSVPRRIATSKKTDTVDNAENRFIKYVLNQFLDFVDKCVDLFTTESREEKEAKALRTILDGHLSHEFFKEISRPTTLALNNPVLQRRSGYREVLRAWLMFDLAAKMIWSGGNDVYEGGKRDIATLYEYWLFFTLYNLFKEKFGLHQLQANDEDIDNLFKLDKNGINLILKSGYNVALMGKCNFGTRTLNIKYSYNRSFGGGNKYEERKAGSWSTTLRPDYTISFWPEQLNEKEAEQFEEIVHIHFDAKYKVSQFTVNTMVSEEDLNEEEEEERKGIYKNPDLLKMHAYRDAIRRTSGAYVLYPGTESKEFNGFHEVVPGLGAFAVNPSDEVKGVKNISSFIDQVVDNLLNRSSQRERMSSQIYKIHENDKPDTLKEPFPEYINGKKVIPDDVTVVMGYYKSQAHLDWILEKRLYNFRTGTRKGSIEMSPENIGARFIVLHGKGDNPTSKIFSLSPKGPRIFSGTDLLNGQYPAVGGDLYLVYQIIDDMSLDFDNAYFDLNKIDGFANAKTKYGPVTCSLKELFYSKVL